MPACAYRMAPVQVKWVGMQNHSSGLAEMDWILTDRWETPPALAHLYSERLLSLPDGYVCYSPPPYAPDVAPLPALSPRAHHLWLLQQSCEDHAARDRDLVRDPAASAGFAAGAEGASVRRCRPPPERVLRGVLRPMASARSAWSCAGRSGHRTFIGQYNDIDIVLDPFPYSGGLTTCEALWMGVPTVTMPGEIFASRHSVSHLSNAGLGDWVAADIVGLCRSGRCEGIRHRRSRDAAFRAARPGEGESVVRCAALRPQPGRRTPICVA